MAAGVGSRVPLTAVLLSILLALLVGAIRNRADAAAAGAAVGHYDADAASLMAEGESLDEWIRMARDQGISLEELLERPFENRPDPGWTGDNTVKFLLQNNSALVQYQISFRPERPTDSIDNYTFSYTSSNNLVLDLMEGVNFNLSAITSEEISPPFNPPVTVYNLTFLILFDEYTGITDIGFTATNTASYPVRVPENYTFVTEFTAAGFVLYSPIDPFNGLGFNLVNTGADRNNVLDAFTSEDFPGKYDFGVFVQFFNGTSTNFTVSGIPMDPVTAVVDQNNLLVNQPPECTLTSGEWTGTEMDLGNCSYSFNSNVAQGENYFGLQLEFQREGDMLILFTWPDFPDFEEGIDMEPDFQNFYEATVIAREDIGPVVFNIDPDGFLRVCGGEELIIDLYNADGAEQIRFFLQQSPQAPFPFISVVDVPETFSQRAVVTTLPYDAASGVGRSQTWVVRVAFPGSVQLATDITDPTYVFMYAPEPMIDTIAPSSSDSLDGGFTVTLTGTFDTFNPVDFPDDNLLINNQPIDKERITFFNSTTVQFTMPSLVELDPTETQFEYLISVQICTETSNQVSFVFNDLRVMIVVFGASQNPNTGAWEFTGGAVITLQAIVTGNVDGLTYQWTFNADTPNGPAVSFVPALSSTTVQTIEFTYEQIDPDGPVPRTFFATVDVMNALGATADDTVELLKLDPDETQIVVNIIDNAQSGRSRAFPVAPLEFVSEVEVLNPPTTAFTLTYEWTYISGPPFIFTVDTQAPDDATTASRLGRVFTVPQPDIMAIEGGINPISLRVFITEQPDVVATASSNVVITEARLVAVIRDGSQETSLGGTSDFVMTAENSYDPDILAVDGIPQNTGLIYDWVNVTKADNPSFTGAQVATTLFPSDEGDESYTISAATFDGEQIAATTYYRFSLRVLKPSIVSPGTNRRSNVVTLTVIRDADVQQEFVQLEDVSYLYLDGAAVNLAAVNPLESLVITPITDDPETTYEYVFIGPPAAAEITENFIFTGTGFYNPLNGASNLPLRIAAGGLGLGDFQEIGFTTTYTLEITVFNPNLETNVVVVSFSTIPQPSILNLQCNRYEATQDQQLRCSSELSFFGDRGTLAYQYTYTEIVGGDATGAPYCAGGCSNDYFVIFQISRAGTYRLRVAVIDPKSGIQFVASDFPEDIVITPTYDSILTYSNTQLNLCADAGDHECVEQISYNLAKELTGGRRRRRRSLMLGGIDEATADRQVDAREDVSLTELVQHQTQSEVVANALARVRRSSGNSFPTTELLNNYLETIQLFSELEDDIVISTMLSDMLLISRTALSRKPDFTTISDFAIQRLQVMYGNLPPIAQNIGEIEGPTERLQGGSTRRRLLQETGDNPNDRNINLANVYASQGIDLTFASADNSACGFFREVDVTVTGGSFDDSIVFVSTRCSVDQNTVDGPVVAGTNTLTICNEVFQSGLRTLSFYLVSTPEFAWLSGYENSVIPSSNLQLPQVYIDTSRGELPAGLPEDCFTLTTQLNMSGAPTDLMVDTFQLTPQTLVTTTDVPSELYLRSDTGQTAGELIEDGDNVFQEIFIIPSSAQGDQGILLGAAIRGIITEGPITTLPSEPPTSTVPSSTTTESPPGPPGGLSGGAIAGIVVGILLFIIIAVIIAWLIATRCFIVAAPPPEEPFDYVERDIYGRGFVVEQSVFSEGSVAESGFE
ncbi:hypothetical protein FVE85_6252 [Porphyridium purpureum]|uniref:PKD/REJ-like domain-containing protein n=1 Tax=Porphyridium purpureum TaxID=35688 RepID=A0A5J4Z7M0_PORPP|nr:hypothetical protein FVE85_6252 [Porphyridium purpureum]|eukprot:POR2378..scf295_1